MNINKLYIVYKSEPIVGPIVTSFMLSSNFPRNYEMAK